MWVYISCLFSISPEPISNTRMFIYFCVLHTYHCVPFTGECHGTAAYKAQTTSIYDIIGHRLILFLPQAWTLKGLKDVILELWITIIFILFFFNVVGLARRPSCCRERTESKTVTDNQPYTKYHYTSLQ